MNKAPQFSLYGLAGQKVLDSFSTCDWPKTLSLMDFLIQRGFPIASTCLGMGVCQRCIVGPFLGPSCQIFCFSPYPRESLLVLSVTYL
jgi:hypothetical protein